MRVACFALLLLLPGTPAMAQSSPMLQVPPELSDPKVAERMGQMTQALGTALLNLPVGELEAVAEGRQPTAEDRRRTVRDSAREDNPNFDRDFQQQLAQAKPIMESSMKAMSAALPQMLRALKDAGEALERATANLPSPNYPKR